MKRFTITIVAILLANLAFSQDFFDALRYSQTNYGGSARSIAMGSAFGSLGGDFSSASINPAGLGLYRSGEFAISPTLNINDSKSGYLGTSSTDNKYSFNFDNLSYVVTSKTGSDMGILGFSFGVGFNRLKNFNSNISILGHGAQSTLLNYYTDWANSINDPASFDNLNEGLAWNTYLIDAENDPNVTVGKYYNDLATYNAIYDGNGTITGYELAGVKPHTQKSYVEQRGYINEYLLSMGFNVDNKFYFGASVGLLSLEYREITNFSEIDDENLSDYLKNYTLTTDLSHSGVGVNFKAGIIYRPMKSLRLGLAVHTPNFYTISYSENKRMVANYDLAVGNSQDGYSTYHDRSADAYPYKFKFETPFKAVASASYLFGNRGLLSVDYEYTNYNSARIRDAGDNWDYSNQNSDIQKIFHATGNLNIGGEFRATNNFSLRGGYQLIGNPWNKLYSASDGSSVNMANYNDSYMTYSAGFGYRQQNFFIDFAYRLSSISEAYKVFELSATDPANGTNIASLKKSNSQATLTLGFRF